MNAHSNTYQAVELKAYNANPVRALLSLELREKTLRPLQPNELLVSMQMASCNPSDIAFIQGNYAVKKQTPVVMGFEGAGEIVAVGENIDKNYLWKRVSCFSQQDKDGTWAAYFYATLDEIVVVPDEMMMQQAATFLVNPFTAYGMFQKALERNSKAVVINAAGGRVPAFLMALCKKHQIIPIAIVRKLETQQFLKNTGIENVLLSKDENFEMKLKTLTATLQANLCFDAVGGNQTALLLHNMPSGSEVVVYGGLSGKSIEGIDTLELIFKNKHLLGFNLNDWLKTLSETERKSVDREVAYYVTSRFFDTPIQQTIPITDVVQGIRAYIGNMSGGKIIITF
jgi:NADPH:quinone reductase-like Zn-dependent oxidoreductase